jgi:hypothetical protein
MQRGQRSSRVERRLYRRTGGEKRGGETGRTSKTRESSVCRERESERDEGGGHRPL